MKKGQWSAVTTLDFWNKVLDDICMSKSAMQAFLAGLAISPRKVDAWCITRPIQPVNCSIELILVDYGIIWPVIITSAENRIFSFGKAVNAEVAVFFFILF